jgi:DNA (cytosine-5)-methyltransferase 1
MFTGAGGFELGIQRAMDNKYESKNANKTNSESGGFRDFDEQGSGVLSSDDTPLCVGVCEIDKGGELGIEQGYMDLSRIKEGQIQTKDEELLPDIGCTDGTGGEQYPVCVGVCENDKYASQLLEQKFKGVKNYGDATTIKPEELPDFDLLVGGFPCQAFSIAGKRRGFEDTRGTLFYEIARIIKVKQPRLLLLENVKGLLNHDKGNTFTQILSTLDELGYDVEWQVLNSKHFGVPQNRERVFIKGNLRGTGGRKIFPIFGTDGKNINVNGILDTETWRKRNESIRRLHSIEGISPTLPAEPGGGVMTKIKYKIDEPKLTGKDKHGLFDGAKIRRLTPTECEFLQSFPRDWTEGFSDTQRYKMMGNAVTVNVVEAIFTKIKQMAQESAKE